VTVAPDIRPLTPARWDDLVDLFGPERGANSGCWCLWPRMPEPAWKAMPRDVRRANFEAIVRDGPPPGLIAYDTTKPVGWVAVGPRRSVARFDAARTSRSPDSDGEGIFAITCFYIRSGYRGRGLMTVLAAAAVDFARQAGASALDVCAIDTERKLIWGEGFVGLAAVFKRLGFVEIARRTPTRPLMRLRLGGDG
jgi:GNAT superfamily N-acetyltransferase